MEPALGAWALLYLRGKRKERNHLYSFPISHLTRKKDLHMKCRPFLSFDKPISIIPVFADINLWVPHIQSYIQVV